MSEAEIVMAKKEYNKERKKKYIWTANEALKGSK